jgi:small-conductance mechanosensitive channel
MNLFITLILYLQEISVYLHENRDKIFSFLTGEVLTSITFFYIGFGDFALDLGAKVLISICVGIFGGFFSLLTKSLYDRYIKKLIERS